MSKYALPDPNPTDPRTAPSLAGAYNAAADAVDDLDYRVAVLEAKPPVVGPEGPQGPPGPATLLGWKATPGDLPPPPQTVGNAWMVGSNMDVYVWNGTTWVNTGSVKGPKGDTGATGATGPMGPPGPTGSWYALDTPAGPVLTTATIEAAEKLLADSVLWLDPIGYEPGSHLPNKGAGGVALNAQLGSAVNADGNDPQWLPYAGEPYVFMPGANTNAILGPQQVWQALSGDIDVRAHVEFISTPSSYGGILQLMNGGGNYGWYFRQDFNRLAFNAAGLASGSVLTGTIAPTAWKWWRVTRVASTGVVTFYGSNDGTTWTTLGSGTTTAQNVPNMDRSDLYPSIGGIGEVGGYYEVTALAGINGTPVITWKASGMTQTGGTDSTGVPWVISRGATGLKAVLVTRPTLLFAANDYLRAPNNAALRVTDATTEMTMAVCLRQWATQGTAVLMGQNTSPDVADGPCLYEDSTRYVAFGAPTPFGSLVGSLRTAWGRMTKTEQVSGWDTTKGAPLARGAFGVNTSHDVLVGTRGIKDTYYADMEFYGAAWWRKPLTDAELATIADYFNSGQRRVPVNGANGWYVINEGGAGYLTTPTIEAARKALADSVLWLDSWDYSGSGALPNKGTGGTGLGAQLGSTSGADSNDPRFLDYAGTPYVATTGGAYWSNYLAANAWSQLANLTTDIEVVARVRCGWPASGWSVPVVGTGSNDNTGWSVYVYSATLIFRSNVTGGPPFDTGAPTLLPNAGTRRWLWLRWVRSTTAVNFYYAEDQADEPTTWTSLGQTAHSNVVTASTATEFLAMVHRQDGACVTADLSRLIIRAGAGGATVEDLRIQDTGALIDQSSQGRWSIRRPDGGYKTTVVSRPTFLFATDDHMIVPDNPALDFGPNEPLTVMGVCRLFNGPNGATTLLTKRHNAPGAWDLTWWDPDRIRFLMQDKGATVGGTATAYMPARGTVTTVFGERDTSKTTVREWANTNEAPVVSDGTAATDTANVATMGIGLGVGGSLYWPDMEFFGAALWRRVLTQSERYAVRDYFNNGQRRKALA